MNEDLGASPDGDRATAVEPVPVSPLRDGIPSAWPNFDYDDGYPEDEEFSAFTDLSFDFCRAAHWLLEELPRAAANMPCFCKVYRDKTEWTEAPCSKIEFSTGGWSGSESIIRLIERRFDMSHFMESWRRGGHFVFEVPDHFLAAQAMSAGTAETEGLRAKPASAVGSADAPGA